MFIHSFKYAMKTMLKNKTALIWTFLFPIALGTLMYMAFGQIYDDDMIFHTIPVAVVKEEGNEAFQQVLNSLSQEGDDQILKVSYMDKSEAEKALSNQKVDGIICMEESLSLIAGENSYSNTVLETILTEYLKQETIISDILVSHPENLETAIQKLTEEVTYFSSDSTSDGNQNLLTNYLYAVLAMSCLFASFGAIEKISQLQGNISPLGMRRCISSTHRATSIVAEFLSMLIVQFIVEVVSLAYFVAIGVDFGDKYLAILGILFFGSCIGIAFGIIIGSIPRLSINFKTTICIAVSMIFSIMADLVATGVKFAIDQNVPIINRINPAALIVDSFYALNIYDTYDRYLQNMLTLGGISILLLIISFVILRRNKYASV